MSLKEQNIETLEIDDFTGGWSQSRTPQSNQSPDTLNCQTKNSTLTHSNGEIPLESGQVVSVDSTDPIYGLIINESTKDIIARTPTKLYRIDNVTIPFNLPPTDITASINLLTPDHPTSTTMYNDALIGCDPNSDCWRVVGNSDAVGIDATGPESAYCCGVFKDRLIFAGIKYAGAWYPTAVVYSDQDDANGWDVAFQRWELETDKTEYCCHVSQMANDLFIYKTNSIAKISGYPPYDWVVERTYVNGIGPLSTGATQRCFLQTKSQLLEVDIFLAYTGLYAFDGEAVFPLPYTQDNTALKDFWKSILWNSTSLNRVVSVYDKANGLYKVWFTDGTSGSIQGIVYDCINNSLWPLSTPDLPYSAAFSIVPDDTNDLAHHVIYGHSNGLITRETSDDPYIPSATTLITNGDMELDANWTTYDPDAAGTVTNERSAVFSYINDYSRHILLGAGASSGGAYQTVAGLTVGNVYRVSCFVKQTIADKSSIVIRSGSTEIASASSDGNAPWEHISVSFVATATSADIHLEVDDVASEAYFDHIQMFLCSREVYYKTPLLDMDSKYTKKLMKESGVEHKCVDNSSFKVTATYDDGAASSSAVSINQSATSSETFRISPLTTATEGIVGDSFRQVQYTLELISSSNLHPTWEISALVMAYTPTGTVWLFN